MKKKNVFLICPIRNIPDLYRDAIKDEVAYLEQQYNVYYPERDTNQNDTSGLKICNDNKTAMKKADLVYVIWDGKSQGVLFDLGMAFAMNKKIRTLVGYMPRMTTGKSFQNMIFEWEEMR